MISKFVIGDCERPHFTYKDGVFWDSGLPANGNLLSVRVPSLDREDLKIALLFCFAKAREVNKMEAGQWVPLLVPDVGASYMEGLVAWPGVDTRLLDYGGYESLKNTVILYGQGKDQYGQLLFAPKMDRFTIKKDTPADTPAEQEKLKNEGKESIKFLGFAFEIDGEVKIIR